MNRALAAALSLAFMAAPAVARAQRMAEHEIGVDAAVAWVKPSGVGASLTIMTPVDVRLGFASRGPLSVEPRLSLFLRSDGGTRYSIDPGVNLLYRLGGTAVNHNRYLTFGTDIDLEKAGTSGAIFALNGGPLPGPLFRYLRDIQGHGGRDGRPLGEHNQPEFRFAAGGRSFEQLLSPLLPAPQLPG
jgi:hypothetical protein